MATLFISDLHLAPDQPNLTALFLHFLAAQACGAEALYILGDLFETWIGDDEAVALQQQISHGLQKLHAQGTQLYYIHGNRDFLLSKKFLAASRCVLLPDPAVIDLYGTPTALTHGDSLCTQDSRYLKFRAFSRNKWVRRCFLGLPLVIRREVARKLRQTSQQHVSQQRQEVLDATFPAISDLLSQCQAKLLIHGHTHQPSIEYFWINNQQLARIVLSDWGLTQGSVLLCRPHQAPQLLPFSSSVIIK